MKRLLIALIVVLSLCSVPAFAQRTGKQTGPVTSSYTLTINVNPRFAFISVDGSPIKGNVATLNAGNHQVDVSAKGFKGYSATVTLSANQVLNVNLEPDFITLTVNVNVPAAIFVDGRPIKGNSTPVMPGQHQVKATAPGFAPYETSVNVDQSMTLNVNLQQDLVDLTVAVNAKGALVFIDGAMIKGYFAKIAPGLHQVKVTAPGYAPYDMSVQVNQSMTLNVNLQMDLLDLAVQVNVKGAQIWVDNELLKGNVARVAPGSHQVQAQAPGYQVYLQTVQVNQSMTLNVNLQQSTFSLNVSCDVKFAQIFINDAEQRAFPVQLPAGRYNVKARAKGYAEYSEDITISGDYNMQIQMRQRMGGIIVSFPDEKGRGNRFGTYDLFIDNQPVKMARERTEVVPGQHRVKLVYDGLVAELDIMVQADTNYTLEPFLQLKVSSR